MLNKKINYKLNGSIFQVNNINKQDEITIMQACHIANIEIPRFCYYDGLSISGNCRMCLVEVKNVQKPVASCGIPLVENMEIFTNSVYIYKIRESILEYILINHPLDCPICDQAGECDLQDQAYVFGGDRSRYYEDKKVVLDKECGPFLTTVMTRCIHCTRCVRFYNEIVGIDVLGVLNRGNNMEISFYVKNLTTSELSGNLSDICPVGAILTKSHIFQKRSWELFFLSTFDVLDTFGSLIRIDIFGNKIFRILPRYNLYLNEEWITDRARFFFDGYLSNRSLYPIVKELSKNIKNKKNFSIYIPLSWYFVFNFIQKLFYVFSKKKNFLINVNLGNIIEVENLIAIKEFFEHLGLNFLISFQKNINIQKISDFSFPFFLGSYNKMYNSKILILFNFNVRLEIPLLNLKFRKIFLKKNVKFLVFSNIASLNFFFKSIGFSIKSFYTLIEGRLTVCKKINNKITNFGKKILIFGHFMYQKIKSNIFYFLQSKLNKFIYNIQFNFLNSNTALLNSNELNMNQNKYNYFKFLKKNVLNYNIMYEDSQINDSFSNLITIRQNSHFFSKVNIKDQKTILVLSCNSFLENTGIFFNIEGRILKTRKFLMTKKVNVFKNFFIFHLIMKKIGYLFFKNILSLRRRLIEINPNFLSYFHLNFGLNKELQKVNKIFYFLLKRSMISLFFNKNFLKTAMLNQIKNPYANDDFTKSSKFLRLAYNRLYLSNLDFFFLKN